MVGHKTELATLNDTQELRESWGRSVSEVLRLVKVVSNKRPQGVNKVHCLNRTRLALTALGDSLLEIDVDVRITVLKAEEEMIRREENMITPDALAKFGAYLAG